MAEWQPIETAPKDGTPVLLWLGDPWSRVALRKWRDHYWTDCDGEHWQTGYLVPTHWMPLPEPPNA